MLIFKEKISALSYLFLAQCSRQEAKAQLYENQLEFVMIRSGAQTQNRIGLCMEVKKHSKKTGKNR